MNSQEQKKEFRNQSLKLRDAITVEERIEKSLAATDHGKANIQCNPGMVISGFYPIRSEIDPRPLMDFFRMQGCRLCLPVVMDRETIVFRELVRTAELVDTGFGTRGPGPEAQVLDPELLVMPMSAFDLHGGRIGYGAGHYDRAIARLIAKGIKPELVGMAFDCQKTDRVPVETHDQPLAAVLSESGYFPVKEN